MTSLTVPLQLRHGTAAAWTSANPILLSGEKGVETDTGLEKIGNGTSHWTALAYQFDAKGSLTPRSGSRPVGQGEQLFNVMDYSAVGDAQSNSNGAITAASHNLTGTGFAAGDVGKVISVVGAGPAGATLSTTISAFTSSTSVTLTAAASTTVSGVSVTWGTDDTAAINAVIAAAPAGSRVQLGLGKAHLTSGLLISGKVGLIFDGLGGKILLKGTGARHGIELAGTCTNVHVVNQNIFANGVIADAHAGVIVHDSASNIITDCSVSRSHITKPTVGVSVELSASGGTVNGWTVADNYIDTPTGTAPGVGYGIHISAGVQATATGARITGNKIRNAQRHAIYSAHGIGTVIAGNNIWGHRTGVNSGTVTAAINVLRSSKVTVVGNTCQFGYDGAFNFASDTGAADTLTCVGNTFTDPMDAVSVVNLGDPTPTPTTPTRNAFFGQNTVSTTNTGPLVTVFCGVNTYVVGSTLNFNNAAGGSAVVLYGYGDSASATFNNNIVIANNAITMEGGGTNIAFRLAGIEATTATVDFRNNPLSGVTTTFAAAANPTNPNLLFHGHKLDGLTFAATVGLREVPLAPVLFVPNSPIAPPTTTPGGMYLWSQGGSLRGHVTNGTKTIIGNVTSASANYSVAVTDEVVLASGGSGGIAVTLPASTRGMRFLVVKGDNTAGAVTIGTTSSQLINGASTYVLAKQYDAVELLADGTGWTAFADATGKVATETTRATTAEALLIPLTQKGAASGVATLDSGGKIPAGQIPQLALNQVWPAASQAAMLALAANPGDVAVRSDTSSAYMLSAAPASTLGNWTLISIDAAPVVSVAGRTGAVTLAVADVTGAAPLASPGLTGSPTAPTQAALDATTKVATTAYADAAVGVEKARALAAEAVALLGAPPPKTGQWQYPSNMVGEAATALSGTSGQGTFCYYDVRVAMTIQQIGLFVNVAAVGGTSPELRFGIFADDGSLSYPGALILDCGANALTSTSTQGGSVVSQLLAPGRYWVGCKWTFSVVPTTLPQVQMINAAAPGLPGPAMGNNYRGYITTGLAAGAWSGSAPAGMSPSGGVTVVAAGIKAA